MLDVSIVCNVYAYNIVCASVQMVHVVLCAHVYRCVLEYRLWYDYEDSLITRFSWCSTRVSSGLL